MAGRCLQIFRTVEPGWRIGLLVGTLCSLAIAAGALRGQENARTAPSVRLLYGTRRAQIDVPRRVVLPPTNPPEPWQIPGPLPASRPGIDVDRADEINPPARPSARARRKDWEPSSPTQAPTEDGGPPEDDAGDNDDEYSASVPVLERSQIPDHPSAPGRESPVPRMRRPRIESDRDEESVLESNPVLRTPLGGWRPAEPISSPVETRQPSSEANRPSGETDDEGDSDADPELPTDEDAGAAMEPAESIPEPVRPADVLAAREEQEPLSEPAQAVEELPAPIASGRSTSAITRKVPIRQQPLESLEEPSQPDEPALKKGWLITVGAQAVGTVFGVLAGLLFCAFLTLLLLKRFVGRLDRVVRVELINAPVYPPQCDTGPSHAQPADDQSSAPVLPELAAIDFADAKVLLKVAGGTWDDKRQAFLEEQQEAEQAILQSIYEDNLELRDALTASANRG